MSDFGVYFFFQAEDGIRDLTVTGVQTCALPISGGLERRSTPVRSIGCDGIKSIGYGEDSRAEKYLFSLNAARIARAAVLLVVHEKEFGGLGKKGDILDDVEPDLHMLLHDL